MRRRGAPLALLACPCPLSSSPSRVSLGPRADSMHDPDPYIMCMPGDLRGIMRARLLEMQLAYASARVRFECSRKLRRKNMFDGVALVRGWVIGSLDRRTAFQCPSRPSPSLPPPTSSTFLDRPRCFRHFWFVPDPHCDPIDGPFLISIPICTKFVAHCFQLFS